MKTTIYANYGVLAHEKQTIYTTTPTDEAVYSEHYIKSSIGTKTLEKIIYDDHSPDDRQYWADIITAMKKEWEDYCIAHMWD